MLALAQHRASLCPCGCGHMADDTTASEEAVRFEVPPPARCLAREALIIAQEAHNRERPGALLWRVRKVV